MKYSWFYRFLLFILLVHLCLLTMQLRPQAKTMEKIAPLKVQVVKTTDKKILLTYRKQIVQSEDPQKKYRPKDSSYLSDKTRAFDRQTKARLIAPFQSSSAAAPSKTLSLKDLGAFSAKHDPFHKSALEYAHKQKNLPSKLSATSDHLLDVPLGDLTNLNTVEYKYYGFYHRIRQKLEQFWGQSIYQTAQAMQRQRRSLASGEELLTALRVTMNALGEITRILIRGSSGIQELDEAAIESFNRAGPFPNPPRGLIIDGTVTIEWGFVVKT